MANNQKHPVYDGVTISAQEFIIWSGALSLHEIGCALRKVRHAVLEGDIVTARAYPFVGRLIRNPRPRARITEATRRRIFERDGYHCVDCGSRFFLELDHIEPVVFGGGDEDANLQTLCRTCNRTKGPFAHALKRAEGNA